MRRILLTIVTVFCLAGAGTAGAGEGFVEANGLRFHYVEEGNGPPLLLIHGGSLTLDSWRKLIPRAASRFHVYAYDTRGHGATENPDGRFSYDLLTSDAAAVIGALKLDRPLVVGYSDGGVTALMLSIKHPGLPRAVVVGGTSDKIAANPRYFEGMRAFFGTGAAGAITDADLDALASSQQQTAAFYSQIHRRGGDPAYWRVLLKQIWPMWMTRLVFSAEQLRDVKAPMLVLLADGDEFSDVRDAVSLREGVTNSELAILPGSRHTVFHDRPELFNTLVMDFLSAHAR